MATKTIASEWESYRSRVMNPKAGEQQIREARCAFYGGALTLFNFMMTQLDPGEEPTDDDMRRMNDIQAELIQFGKDVLAGKK